MNKKEFAQALSEQHGWTPAESAERLDAILDTMVRTLVSGKAKRVAFTGFGSFELFTYAAKYAYNLSLNTRVAIPERTGLRFRPGTAFMAMLRGEKPLPEGRNAALKAAKTKKPKETGDA